MESSGFGRAAFVDEEQGFVCGKNAVGIIAVYVPLPDEPPQCVTFQNLLPDMVQQVKAFARGMEVREPQVLVTRLSAPVYGEVECPVRVEHMQAMRLFVLNVYLVPVCLEPGGVCYRFLRVGQGDEGATGRVQPLVGGNGVFCFVRVDADGNRMSFLGRVVARQEEQDREEVKCLFHRIMSFHCGSFFKSLYKARPLTVSKYFCLG